MSIFDKIKASARKVVKETSELLLNIANHVSKNSIKYTAIGVFGMLSYFGIDTNLISPSESINVLMTMAAVFVHSHISIKHLSDPTDDEDLLFYTFIVSATTLFVSDTSTANYILAHLPNVESLHSIVKYSTSSIQKFHDELVNSSDYIYAEINKNPKKIFDFIGEFKGNSKTYNKKEVDNIFSKIFQSDKFQLNLATIPVMNDKGNSQNEYEYR